MARITKAPQADSENTYRYSEQLPAEKRQQVQQISEITAGGTFRTRTFFVEDQDEDIAPGPVSVDGRQGKYQYREARKNPAGTGWDLYDCASYDGLLTDENGQIIDQQDNEPVYKPHKLAAGLCLMDTLAACAVFETSGVTGFTGTKALEPSSAALQEQHYRHFARAQGIVFDRVTHMPVPVLAGCVLDDEAVLSEVDKEIVAQFASQAASAAQEVEPVCKSSAIVPRKPSELTILKDAGPPVMKEQVSVLDHTLEATLRNYRELEKCADHLASAFNSYASHGGGLGEDDLALGGLVIGAPSAVLLGSFAPISPAGPVDAVLGLLFVLSVFSASIGGAVYAANGKSGRPRDHRMFPEDQFRKALMRMNAELTEWPETAPQRQAAEWLVSQYEQASAAICLSQAFQRQVRGRELDEAIMNFASNMKNHGLPDDEIGTCTGAIKAAPKEVVSLVTKRMSAHMMHHKTVMGIYREAQLNQIGCR